MLAGGHRRGEEGKMRTFRYEVYATAFHGGYLISRHKTEWAAERAGRKYRMTSCSCGCAGVIDTDAGEKPGTQSEQDQWNNPYAIGAV